MNPIFLVARREEGFLKGYEKFAGIDGKFILGNGILIDDNGHAVWNTNWVHDYFHATYLKKQNVILTDRRSCPGPVTMDVGSACIDFTTGEYLWKNWYENEWDERLSFRKRVLDVKLNSWFNGIEQNGEWIWSGDFRIHLKSGQVENILKLEEHSILVDLPPILPEIPSIGMFENPDIQLGVREVMINGHTFSIDGYFFNKSNVVMVKEPFYYFFGVPENKNPEGGILFKYNTEEKRVVKEIELPFRYPISGVYDFFQKGILVYEQKWGKNPVNALWVIKNEAL